ncbi:MAG: hypothetical protein BMS9Abin33_0625 [Gammaproteobacteria bacterium]|nr:MAG: hypothetical protein BMS9Abin33_0625 [Gammaproteobacteria bacterium]
MRLKFLIILLAITASTNVWADGKVYVIRTNYLDCDYCAYDLEEKFLKMKGVKDFEVDLDGILFVKTDNSVKLTEPYVKKLLLDNGFDYKGMTVKTE